VTDNLGLRSRCSLQPRL